MHLRSFKAQGFKNFRQPVVLDDLGVTNVVHGPNNVGKSNLLEAIGLFFFLVGLQDDMGILVQRLMPLADETLEQAGFPRTEIYHLEAPNPIRLEAEVALTPEDLQKAGLTQSSLRLETLRITVELRWMGTYSAFTVARFETADGRDFAMVNRSHPENAELSAIAVLLSRNVRSAAEPSFRFQLVDIDRRQFSATLALSLYDAKESPDLELARRWDRFVEAMAEFKDILGEGKFVATYDRKAKRGNLLYQTARARVPLNLLGSGVQQLAVLLGTLLVSGATLAGLEEPELNLRYTLQHRLREVLTKVVGVPGGLDQLFLTSHSDAFEAASHFYLMEPTPDGPRVSKQNVQGVRAAIGMTDDGSMPDPRAALCYLSTEGVVRVPDRIRRALGLPHGGGVVFLEKEDGAVEVMSDDTFADRFEPKRDGERDEQT